MLTKLVYIKSGPFQILKKTDYASSQGFLTYRPNFTNNTLVGAIPLHT